MRWPRSPLPGAAAALAATALGALVLAACGSSSKRSGTAALPGLTALPANLPPPAPPPTPAQARQLGARTSVYRWDVAGSLSPRTRGALSRVYVPNSVSNTVDVIDPARMRVVAHFKVGAEPQHVTPAWNLQRLYVDNDQGNSLTPIDPRTARPGKPIRVADPYNLYFTPDGANAIVVAERLQRLDFRDARTMRLVHSLHVPCFGVDHVDFAASGRRLFASCEFAGTMIAVDLARQRVVKRLKLGRGAAQPQDVKLSPDGRVLYVADQINGGVWEVDPRRFVVIGFLATGSGAHGLYPSRGARFLFVSNRNEGSVSVISFARRRVVKKWRIPGGASPDMGGVSADGRVLWLSGRFNAEVYALSTSSGRLLARIPVGQGPHGLCVWPQPGRYSLGHTGNMR